MSDVNHVTLIGRLTRDSELKYTASGQAICKFSIAVNRRRKSGDQWVEEANFFDAIIWGNTAESLNQYLVKGKQVAVDGELRQERWESEGRTHSRIEVNANNVQLFGGGQDRQQTNTPKPSQRGRGPSLSNDELADIDKARRDGLLDDGGDGFADDIPF